MGRRWLTVVVVCLASAGAGVTALASLRLDRELSVGTVRIFSDPGHRGALDLYVPLVDWGVRFGGVRVPVRLRVDVQRIDRDAAVSIAREGAGSPRVIARVKRDARNAIASYLRILVLLVFGSALGFGLIVALALRGAGLPLLPGAIAAAATALALGVAIIVLLPPRGDLGTPEYYAHGPDIPRALRAVESAEASANVLTEELDGQIVGLARLVTDPAGRATLGGRPQITVASDLHNNLLAVPALQRVARGTPLFFVGDLTDRGTPLEAQLTSGILHAGTRLVFVTGNHDSDSEAQELADDGAIVLTEHGRLRRGGRYGPTVVRVAGLRVAGYGDPFRRRRARGYVQQPGALPAPSAAEQNLFAEWFAGLEDRVDVVMVHEPALAAKAIDALRRDPPSHPIVMLVGHTHRADIRIDRDFTLLNGGTVGAGGTGNLDEGAKIGVARMTYATGGAFMPLAADLVEIDPGNGSATAKRFRLDEPPAIEGRK
jgi:predicted phosphodiesterase